MGKPKRWRLWICCMGQHRKKKAAEELKKLREKGFRAKVWMPRPEHKTSGHIHIVVLCTFDELCKLAGITPRVLK